MRLSSELNVLLPIPIAVHVNDWTAERLERLEYLAGPVGADVTGHCDDIVVVRLLRPQLAPRAGYVASSSSGSPCQELVSTFISVWFDRSLSGSLVVAAVVQINGKFSSIVAASDPDP